MPESNDSFWRILLHYEDVQGVSELKIPLSGLFSFNGFGAAKITREVSNWVADFLDQAVVQY